jgi:hypothetical protein
MWVVHFAGFVAAPLRYCFWSRIFFSSSLEKFRDPGSAFLLLKKLASASQKQVASETHVADFISSCLVYEDYGLDKTYYYIFPGLFLCLPSSGFRTRCRSGLSAWL